MRRIFCLVTRSELAKDKRAYPPWEIPVLKLVHADQVKVLDEQEMCDKRVPDPADEYMRLERRFGVDSETKVSRVSAIYGAGDVGIQNLAHAMREALEEQEMLDEAAATKEREELGAKIEAQARASLPPVDPNELGEAGEKHDAAIADAEESKARRRNQR